MAGHLLTCNPGLQEHWQTNAQNKGNMPASTNISVLQLLLFSAKLRAKSFKIAVHNLGALISEFC